LVAQGQEVKLVAETVGISRSSLYYKRKPHPSRADRRLDGIIVEACGAKPAYGYRRVAWWMHRKQGLEVNGKRVLRVMRERGLLVTPRRTRARRKKEWSRIVAELPNQLWQTDMTKVWAGANVGWAYLVSVIDCCTRDIVGWGPQPPLSHARSNRCRRTCRAGADVGRFASLRAHAQHR
jgi:transposase InsO family protein